MTGGKLTETSKYVSVISVNNITLHTTLNGEPSTVAGEQSFFRTPVPPPLLLFIPLTLFNTPPSSVFVCCLCINNRPEDSLSSSNCLSAPTSHCAHRSLSNVFTSLPLTVVCICSKNALVCVKRHCLITYAVLPLRPSSVSTKCSDISHINVIFSMLIRAVASLLRASSCAMERCAKSHAVARHDLLSAMSDAGVDAAAATASAVPLTVCVCASASEGDEEDEGEGSPASVDSTVLRFKAASISRSTRPLRDSAKIACSKHIARQDRKLSSPISLTLCANGVLSSAASAPYDA